MRPRIREHVGESASLVISEVSQLGDNVVVGDAPLVGVSRLPELLFEGVKVCYRLLMLGESIGAQVVRLGESRLRLGPGILDPGCKLIIQNCRREVLIICMTVDHLTQPTVEGR